DGTRSAATRRAVQIPGAAPRVRGARERCAQAGDLGGSQQQPRARVVKRTFASDLLMRSGQLLMKLGVRAVDLEELDDDGLRSRREELERMLVDLESAVATTRESLDQLSAYEERK